jgi:response regulator RpfG family c-di-GMP phosphodiesterase
MTHEPATSHRDDPIVLLVDDQLIIVEAVRRILAAEKGIEFHCCQKGDEALAIAARIKPTVILQDLVMPDADGLDLVRAYRQQDATRDTPLIVLSSKEEGATKAEAFVRGANDYLVKLPDPVELVARVRYHSRMYRLLMQAKALAEAEKQRFIAERQAVQLRARNTLIFGLAKLAESRDSDTGEHLERIAAYSRVLAEQLRVGRPELSDDWIANLQLASSLHDIGKVGIPDAVLLKAGKLTPEERHVMQRHPGIGAEALDAILARDTGDELLRMARNIAAATTSAGTARAIPGAFGATLSRLRPALSASPTSTTLSLPGASTSRGCRTSRRWSSSSRSAERSSIPPWWTPSASPRSCSARRASSCTTERTKEPLHERL